MAADLNHVLALLSPEALELADLYAVLDELEVVLRCCERLMVEIERRPQLPEEVDEGDRARINTPDAPDARDDNDGVVIEGLWTLALLSYRRAFAPGALPGTGRLTVDDLKAVQPDAAATEWHDLLLRLRAHHGHERLDPREEFAVGAAQEEGGRVVGIAVTSRRQPPVDDVTVRQTGALAYSLRQLVGRRINESEAALLESVSSLPRGDLDALAPLDIAPPNAASLN